MCWRWIWWGRFSGSVGYEVVWLARVRMQTDTGALMLCKYSLTGKMITLASLSCYGLASRSYF